MSETQRKRLGTPTRTAADWEEAALDCIADGGIRAVAVPALATALGVTKGSFYWHFDGLEALLEAAMKRFEMLDAQTMEQLAQTADPALRLRAAFAEAMEATRAQSLYVALSASVERSVTNVLRRVSRKRIRFLREVFLELGLTESEAHDRALLTYSAYLGVLHLRRQSTEGLRTPSELEAYLAHAGRTLIPKKRR